MATWFSVRVMYDKLHENGMKKKVKELFLIDALSFTEAEARAIGEMKPYTEGDLRVTAMKIEDIAEIFNQEENEKADKWYRVKVAFVSVDKKTRKEKKVHQSVLVKGVSTEDATKVFHEGMKGTMADYEIHTVSETQYMDVFFYSLDKVSDETR